MTGICWRFPDDMHVKMIGYDKVIDKTGKTIYYYHFFPNEEMKEEFLKNIGHEYKQYLITDYVQAERTVFLRISLYGSDPREFDKTYRPQNINRVVWTLHTVADQVHIFYEFKTIEEKNEWLKNLPEEYIKLIGNITQEDIDQWQIFI